MRCGECPAGKRISRNGHRCVYCLLYGIIVRESHECTRDDWKRYKRPDDDDKSIGAETEIQEDGCGPAGAVPGVLPGSGERAGLSGMEGWEDEPE